MAPSAAEPSPITSATNQPKKRTRGVGSRTLGHTYIEDRAKRRKRKLLVRGSSIGQERMTNPFITGEM